jgi:hypothetical protein
MMIPAGVSVAIAGHLTGGESRSPESSIESRDVKREDSVHTTLKI